MILGKPNKLWRNKKHFGQMDRSAEKPNKLCRNKKAPRSKGPECHIMSAYKPLQLFVSEISFHGNTQYNAK